MNNSEKLLKMLSGLIETGVLTSQDIAKGLLTSVKFNKEKFASKLDLVTRDEFNVLKKIIEKQQKEIINLKKRSSRQAPLREPIYKYPGPDSNRHVLTDNGF